MPYRIFMTIQRGTMDKTAVCVFPWERPIIEEIHGGNAAVVSISEMASMQGASKIVTVELKNPDAKLAPNLAQQLQAMTAVDRQSNPFNDLDAEFNRLIGKYGMHDKVPMPVAEKVFGTVSGFRLAVNAYRGDTPPKEDPLYPEAHLEEGGFVEDGDRAPADMTREELKAALDLRGVAYARNATDDKLVELLTEQITESA